MFRMYRKPFFVPSCMFSITNSVFKQLAEPRSNKILSKLTGNRTDLWKAYNEVVYPPVKTEKNQATDQNELHRSAEVTFRREDILYSHKKLWVLSFLIRGKSVDESFVRLGFQPEKGARILEALLEEAIELGVKEHNFEFCTKIWIESLYVCRGRTCSRIYKDVRTSARLTNYHYANIYIRLREGEPPKYYHPSSITSVWTPSPSCPAKGRSSWGDINELVDKELDRIRSKRLKCAL